LNLETLIKRKKVKNIIFFYVLFKENHKEKIMLKKTEFKCYNFPYKTIRKIVRKVGLVSPHHEAYK